MPEYKLTYFNVRGRGEAARWMFKYANVPFEDERIEGTWAERKPSAPYGKIPTLYVDGKFIYSSAPICRFLGKKFGLIPKDDYMQAVCDEIVDAVNDLSGATRAIFGAKREGKQEEAEKLMEEFKASTFPPCAKTINERLQGKKYIAGNEISWADFYVAYMAGTLDTMMNNKLLTPYPNLKAMVDRVHNLPAIAKWIKERPVTTM